MNFKGLGHQINLTSGDMYESMRIDLDAKIDWLDNVSELFYNLLTII